jgi:myo-inositol 2-dehydrogenase/D-chiro-inositol 1-dehydrogenase
MSAPIVARRREAFPHLAMAAAAKGKAIFCEKPIDLDLERTDQCLAAVEKAGVPFQIGFNRRFDPSFRALRPAV